MRTSTMWRAGAPNVEDPVVARTGLLVAASNPIAPCLFGRRTCWVGEWPPSGTAGHQIGADHSRAAADASPNSGCRGGPCRLRCPLVAGPGGLRTRDARERCHPERAAPVDDPGGDAQWVDARLEPHNGLRL